MQLTQTRSQYTPNRIYIDEDGNRYPSSSTVAGFFFNKAGLFKWRQKVGYEEAERIKEFSATRGTAIHDAIEKNTLTGNPDFDEFIFRYKEEIEPYLKILHAEIALGYSYPFTFDFGGEDKHLILRTAGKADNISVWKDELIVGDFKTSDDGKPKKAAFMGQFSIQCSIYALGYEREFGEPINTGVIFNLMPSSTKVLHIPLEQPKQILKEYVLPAFYRYYMTPECYRPYPNQFEDMGKRLDKFQRELSKQIY